MKTCPQQTVYDKDIYNNYDNDNGAENIILFIVGDGFGVCHRWPV